MVSGPQFHIGLYLLSWPIGQESRQRGVNLKLKSGDKLAFGRHAIAVHLPRGRGRVAVLTVPPELRGRVRLIKRRKDETRKCGKTHR
jgi:hypothetical protein